MASNVDLTQWEVMAIQKVLRDQIRLLEGLKNQSSKEELARLRDIDDCFSKQTTRSRDELLLTPRQRRQLEKRREGATMSQEDLVLILRHLEQVFRVLTSPTVVSLGSGNVPEQGVRVGDTLLRLTDR